jgi:hypothetical protein
MDTDKTVRNAFDISAIQIQQLNGSVQSHALVALLFAGLLTVPLLIVGVRALVELGHREVDDQPETRRTGSPETPY